MIAANFPNILKLNSYFLLILALLVGGISPFKIFAHGGEDHGDSKPKTTASSKGTISQTAKLGKYELMLKYPVPAPDTAMMGSIFLTDYATNTPIENANLAVEIESAALPSVVEAVIEKSGSPGVYNVKLPALTAGKYTIRAKLAYAGETDTATFSGVEIKNQSAENFNRSSLNIVLMISTFALILASFGSLIYFAVRPRRIAPIAKQTVSV